ncbi:Phenoloxidase-activating enzyme [Pseudolycoriella hygida]|uniref:Phenoloxidase-activating enzyme n=1 Tax=Pseudolycoriella hygida TaxID=35572 RepID=A0A9Q0MQG2_9DIPT|nr:Phenoloxidase-activating enzyme [Pseudolycoriella hygida]
MSLLNYFKIINGDVTSIDEFPWTVLIRYKRQATGNWGCGGSLVGKKTVLTAAHCVESAALAVLGNIEFVRLGEYDYAKEIDCVMSSGFEDCADRPVDIEVSDIIVHPQRNIEAKLHDIAILVLDEVPPYTDFIRPICLPDQSLANTYNSNDILFVAGWGWTVGSVRSPSNIKKYTALNRVDYSQCRGYYRNVIDYWQICAGGANGQIPCKGDSGGPLMYASNNQWILTGIVSYGPFPCGKPRVDGAPGVFTRVSSHMPWINSILDNIFDPDRYSWEK